MSLETNMGAMIADIRASTQNNYIKGRAVDLLLGMDDAQKGPIDPLQVKLYENKDMIPKGGDVLKWAATEALPVTKTVNAYETYTASRNPSLITFTAEWSLLVTPFLVYGMDAVLNAGKQAMIDLYMQRMLDAYRSHQIGILRRFHGDGATAWNPLLATPAQEAFVVEGGGVPAVGLGYGNSTVTDAIMSTTNSIYGKSRTTKPLLAAKCLDVTSDTDMGTAGEVANGYISNLTLEHFRLGIRKATKMGKRPNIVPVHPIIMDKVRQLANAKGIITENSADKGLLKYGFDNFMVDNVPIVPSDFASPLQINFFNTANTQLAFCVNEEPQLGESVADPNAGWRVKRQEISSLFQIVSYDPSRNACLYNLVVG
jgi:hypothetical protein